MGCMNSPQKQNGYHKPPQSLIQGSDNSNQFKLKKQQQKKQSQQHQQKPSNDYLKDYWKRRCNKICGNNSLDITEDKLNELFSYMKFDKVTIKKLYQYLKSTNKNLPKQQFISYINIFRQSKSEQFINILNHIYIQPSRPSSPTSIPPQKLKKQLAPYIKKNNTNQFKKIQDLKTWLSYHIDLSLFKYCLLQGAFVIDQKQTYKLFLVDQYNAYDNHTGSKLYKQKQLTILSYKWCERMKNYINNKYLVSGIMPRLQRRSTYDSTYDSLSPIPSYNSRIYRRNSVEINLQNNRKMEQKKPQHFDQTKIQLIQKDNKTTINYPGQINNSDLIGTFSWQLKRNIRKNIDYITLSKQTYDSLILCYGGTPPIIRKVDHGYLQLKIYFLLVYQFAISKDQSRSYFLKQKPQKKLSSSDTIFSIALSTNKNIIFYHKNIGQQWTKFFPKNQLNKTKKVIDTFSQTSFLIQIPSELQQNFIKYMSSQTNPTIGQIYSSTSYKIGSIEDKQKQSQPIFICVVFQQSPDIVKFVVLDWSCYTQKSVPKKTFLKQFTIVNNYFRNMGIQNLGNTCYMNSSLQAILSVLKDEYLSQLKGDLGRQLQKISNRKRQKKKIQPAEFKSIFDKYYQYFQGNDQHDVHQFCICLFQQLQKDNKQLIKSILQSNLIQTKKCQRCKKQQQKNFPSFIIQLPLTDYKKRQVKIDYITNNNTLIKTYKFEIQQQSTIKQWKNNFIKVSGAKYFYLCQIENSDIKRIFQDQQDQQLFKLSNIQNQCLITAYQISSISIQHFQDIRKSQNNIQNLRLTNHIRTSSPPKSARDYNIRQSQKNLTQRRDTTNFKKNKQLQDYTTPPKTLSFIKIINFDLTYNQRIGRPFIFKIPSNWSLFHVKQILEQHISKKCNFWVQCTNNKSRNMFRKFCNDRRCKCLSDDYKQITISQVGNSVIFYANWNDISDYNSAIKRVNQPPNTQNNYFSQSQQYDNFSRSIQKSQQVQNLIVQRCDYCKANKVQIQHRQSIIKSPQILVLLLKRFTVKNGKITKIQTRWQLEKQIYLKKQKYALSSVICHNGISADYGHYVAVSKGVKYDDEMVTNMAYEQIPPSQIYMLFYVKNK